MVNEQSQSAPVKFDIVIVGGGVVGATLALQLAAIDKPTPLAIALVEAGAPVNADQPDLEPKSKPGGFDPRVVALTRRSEQLLHSLDAWAAIQADRACAYTDMHVWDADGTGVIHFSCAEVDAANLGHIVENRAVKAALYDQINQIEHIHCWHNAEVEALGGTEQVRDIILADGRVLSADLIIAADGARSKIRELAAMPLRQWEYGHKAIVTTVVTEKPHQFTAWQRFLTTGPLAFLPLQAEAQAGGEEHASSIVWSVTNDQADALMALSETEFNHQLSRAFEHTLGAITHSDQRFSFALTARHASDYHRPGLVLVGDAAHSIHPLAGQGVNLGLADTQVLAEEIARARRRSLSLGNASILRRYQRRRKSHNLLALAVMEGFKRLFGATALPVRLLRNVGLRRVNRMGWLKQQIIKLMLAGDESSAPHR